MSKPITSFVGLDVHKDSTAMAQAEAGRESPRFIGTVGPELGPLLKALKSLGKPETMLVVYEAGPCGYGLVRQLRSHGYACEVVAAGKMARRPGERIKTDRRDALTLARLARSGDLVQVRVPDERDEAMRDLSRTREDAVRARFKARQQLKALLLRHGHRYTGKSSWTLAHERYLATVGFAHPAQDIAFADLLVPWSAPAVKRESQQLSRAAALVAVTAHHALLTADRGTGPRSARANGPIRIRSRKWAGQQNLWGPRRRLSRQDAKNAKESISVDCNVNNQPSDVIFRHPPIPSAFLASWREQKNGSRKNHPGKRSLPLPISRITCA